MKKILSAIIIFIVFIPVSTQAIVFDNLNKINNPLSLFKILKNEFQGNFLIIEKTLISFQEQVKKEAKKQINDVRTVINENNEQEKIKDEQKFQAKAKVDLIYNKEKTSQKITQKEVFDNQETSFINEPIIEREIANNKQSIIFFN